MKKVRNEKAITLVALIITIIVLLILAVVAIRAVTGDGIIAHAKNASKNAKKAAICENVEMYIQSLNLGMVSQSISLQEGFNELKDIPNLGEENPKLGWIYIENNYITKYEFYYDDFYILNINGKVRNKEIDYSTLINVKDFGAQGDGITDDSVSISEAVDYLNKNGGTLYFPTGNYIVSLKGNGETIIKLESEKEINIDFFGSTLVLNENAYTAYNMINLNNCSNVEIRNGNLIGDRIKHDYTTLSGTHEFGYGVFLTQTTGAQIYNMNISNMTGDAIINKNGESGGIVTIDECNLHHCRRQGVSVLDSDVINIYNTQIHHIGTFDNIKGTAPMTGIDIEPASGTKTVNNVVINNVIINDTTSFGIINVRKDLGKIEILNSNISSPNLTNTNIENSFFNYDKNNGLVLDGGEIKNSKLKLNFLGQTLNISGSVIVNCNIEGPESKEAGRVLISNSQVNNTSFKNLRGTGQYSSNSIADFGVIFRGSFNYTSNSNNNHYNNCAIIYAGDVGDEHSCVENSYIFIDAVPTTLNSLEINNCETRSNSVGELFLNDCKIDNSGALGACKKHLFNTNFYIKDIKNSHFPEGSSCDHSTIRIMGTMTKNSLNLIKFFNNSNIILDRYSSINKINNQYSIEATDYSVEYNGSEILE